MSNFLNNHNVKKLELHVSRARFDTGSTLARKLRAERDAGRAKYRPARSPHDQKVYVTVEASSPIADELVRISETVILRDFDREAFTIGAGVPAWAYVYSAKKRGKGTTRVFEGGIGDVELAMLRALTQVDELRRAVRKRDKKALEKFRAAWNVK